MMTRIVAFTALVLSSCGGTTDVLGGDVGTDGSLPDTPADGDIDPVLDTILDTWNDPTIDVITDTGLVDPIADTTPACVTEGCPTWPDGGAPCCPGLVSVPACDGSDPTCTDGRLFCVACGNGSCDPFETRNGCFADCGRDTCDLYTGFGYSCGDTVMSCSCDPGGCMPECIGSSAGMYWMNPCTGEMTDVHCASFMEPACRYVGSWSEGWYILDPAGVEHIVYWDLCAPIWHCS